MNKILVITLLFVVAGFSDLLSTLIGLSRGLIDSNSHFLVFPFAATIFLLIWNAVSYKIPAPNLLKNLLSVWMVVLAFLPCLWNSYLILVFT